MSNTMTYEQIAELEAGAWLNGPIHGTIGRLNMKQGKKGNFFTGSIDIDGMECDLVIFKHDASSFADSEVVIAGKGNKRDEYNGKLKIVVGDKATIKRVSGEQPKASRGTTQAPRPAATPKNTRAVMNQIANVYIQSYNAGVYVKGEIEKHHNVAIGTDQFQALVSSLFIQATREGLHHHADLGEFDWSSAKVNKQDDDDNVPY